MKYKAILLDFDDTLIDTQGYATKCLEQLYITHELNKFFETSESFIDTYHLHIGKLWEDYALGKIDKQTLLKTRFDKTFESFGYVSPDFLEELNDDFVKSVVKNNIYIDGAKEIMEYLKSKYPIAMLSNGFSEMQYDKLNNVGFTDYFDHVILSDVVGVNKPHPAIFNYALQKLGVGAHETIMIGDNYLADIKGAMNSNIDQIWYNPKDEQAELAPTYTINNLMEIKNII